MDMLQHLNEVNDVPVLSVSDPAFLPYGRVISGYDFSEMIRYMESETPIPESGNIYIASDPKMEDLDVCRQIRKTFYGDMPLQAGYCNGRNTTWNGFEYHKGSEINVAVTDLMLFLGHIWQIEEGGHYRPENTQVFYVPRGTAFEMYQTTLHLSPCRTTDEGFRAVVILPRGTNTPLEEKPASEDPEARLLLQRNKWVIAHPEREPLIRQGAWAGLLGENKELHY